MSSIKMFEKPLGMRDTFPQIYEKVEAVRNTGRDFLCSRGYEFIKTPAVEYFDTVGKASAIADAHLFKLVDSQGNTDYSVNYTHLLIKNNEIQNISKFYFMNRDSSLLRMRMCLFCGKDICCKNSS